MKRQILGFFFERNGNLVDAVTACLCVQMILHHAWLGALLTLFSLTWLSAMGERAHAKAQEGGAA